MVTIVIARSAAAATLHRLARVSVIATLVSLAGCNGRGHIQFASLSFQSIDPPNAKVAQLEASECYWWTDGEGRAWVAMQRVIVPPFQPQLRVHMELSLAVDQLPRGRARNYRLDRESLRARIRIGPWETRFTSQTGIAAVYRGHGNHLRGSVRMRAQRVTSQLLAGWGRPSGYLMLVTFDAVPGEAQGTRIVESTESAGWERRWPDKSRANMPVGAIDGAADVTVAPAGPGDRESGR